MEVSGEAVPADYNGQGTSSTLVSAFTLGTHSGVGYLSVGADFTSDGGTYYEVHYDHVVNRNVSGDLAD